MISEKINSKVSPAGEITEVKWKPKVLRKMLLPEKSIVKIPNPEWNVFTYPFNQMDNIINATAARITFNVRVPAYLQDKIPPIAQNLQRIFYHETEKAELHRRAALKTITQMVSKKSPQLFLAGEVVSIFCYGDDYFNAIRFTSWSLIPAELQQIRIIWDEDSNLLNRINDIQVDLLFDQRKIRSEFILKINRRGLLDFPLERWNFHFDLNEIRNRELPQLDKLRTPPFEHMISSDSSPEAPKPRPKKRIRLMNRFMVSSDEE